MHSRFKWASILDPSLSEIFDQHLDLLNQVENITARISPVSPHSIETSDFLESLKEGENSTHVSHSTHVSLSTHVKDVTNSTADNIGKSAVYVSRYIRSTIVPLVKNDSMIETNVKDYVDISQVATIHMTRKNKLFRKKVNFDEIDNSILTLFNMIADLDPSTVREEHVDIKGKSKNFLLLPTLATHGLAELQCNFLNSTLADLSLIDEEGIKVSRTIIVKDVIIKNGDN